MNTLSKTFAILLPLVFAMSPAATAAETHDGSSEKNAIVVPVPDAQLHDWEVAYLKKHFPEHYSFEEGISSLNGEHALIAHEERGKWFDYYSFIIRGKKVEVYFDISKQVEEEYAHSHPKHK